MSMTHSQPGVGPYRDGAVPLGPFDREPFDLQPVATLLSDGSWRSGDDVRVFLGTWLVGALTAAGVELGDYDRVAVSLIAEDGWTTVQVVAGWIARAAQAPGGGAAGGPPLPVSPHDGPAGRDPPDMT
jgi:hypothetical protein